MMAFGSIFLTGCSGDDNAEGLPPGSVSDCMTASDCPADHACIQIGGGAAGCVPTCSGSVDECGGSAECAGVGSVDVDICQEEEPEVDPDDPPTPEEEPRIPCQTDEECSALDPGAICAEWQGQRDCTIPCSSEEVCDVPEIGGVTIDFMNCQDDERSDVERTACLPREECFNNPLDCISGVPGEDDLPDDGGLPGGF